MKDAAIRAQAEHVVFHTFGLGPDTAADPGFLPKIAGATGGTFRGVPDPRQLACQLVAPLMRAGT
jgi:hypothetical protein